jgi:glycerol-3-phosphate dehydrogenase
MTQAERDRLVALKKAKEKRITQKEAADELGTVEGLTTAPVLRELSYRLGIELPITDGVCRVLDGEDLNELAASLMGRQPTRE